MKRQDLPCCWASVWRGSGLWDGWPCCFCFSGWDWSCCFCGCGAGFLSGWLDMEEFLVTQRHGLPVHSAATRSCGCRRLPGQEVRSRALCAVGLQGRIFDPKTAFSQAPWTATACQHRGCALDGRAPKLPLPALDGRRRDHGVAPALGLCAIAQSHLPFRGRVTTPTSSEWRTP